MEEARTGRKVKKMEGHFRIKVKPYEWSLHPSPVTSSCLSPYLCPQSPTQLFSYPAPTQLHSSLRGASDILSMPLPQDLLQLLPLPENSPLCYHMVAYLNSWFKCPLPTRPTLTILFKIVLSGTPYRTWFFPPSNL